MEGMCRPNLYFRTVGVKACEKGEEVYVGFMDEEKAYDRVNRKALL